MTTQAPRVNLQLRHNPFLVLREQVFHTIPGGNRSVDDYFCT